MGKRREVKSDRMNTTMVAALDLSDTEGVTTVLSPYGDVTDSFTIRLDEQGFAQFAGRVPKDARVAFEATGMAYPVHRALTEHSRMKQSSLKMLRSRRNGKPSQQ